MSDNPYAPPTESVEDAVSPQIRVGKLAPTLSFRRAAYLAVVLVGMLLVARRTSEAFAEGIILWIKLITFVFHCTVLLQTRRIARWSVIAINAGLILTAFIFADSRLVIANLVLHVVASIGLWIWSLIEASRFAELVKSPDAILALEKEIESKGDSPTRLTALAGAYRKSDRFSEALTVMQRCLHLAPDHFETHMDIAWLLSETGAYTEAQDAYGRLMKVAENPRQQFRLNVNYCRFLAQTLQLDECRDRLNALEAEIHSRNRVSTNDFSVLATSLQTTRDLLNKLSRTSVAKQNTQEQPPEG